MNRLDTWLLALRLRDAAFTWWISSGFAQIGPGSRILTPFRSSGSSKISLGRNVFVGPGSWLIVPEDLTPGVVMDIGDRVRMNQTSISAVRSVIIEEAVAIGRGAYISDHSHRFDDPDIPIRDQGVDRIAPVRICRGAWLGHHVVVLPGVTIGAGAVIGAHSVVGVDVPARTIAAGAPARILRPIDD